MLKKIIFLVLFFNVAFAQGTYDVFSLPPQYSYLKNTQNAIKNQKEQYTILYLFSNSVNPVSFANMLYGVYAYNKSHTTRLYTTQALIGINPNINAYLVNLKNIIYGASTNEIKNALMGSIHIRMSPEVFERLKAQNVPIVVLAKCKPMANPSKCRIIAIARGDVGVNMFLYKLKEKNLLPKDLPL